MITAVTRLPPYLRYIGVSAAALGVDMGAFLMLMAGGAEPMLAAGMSYAMGVVLHWFLSSRMVFAQRLAQGARDRTRQKALFIMSALLGLGLTMLIVGFCTGAGIDATFAKLIAIGFSFNATYLLRKLIVFA